MAEYEHMTPEQHYRAAGAALDQAGDAEFNGDYERAVRRLAAAQVHATLAKAPTSTADTADELERLADWIQADRESNSEDDEDYVCGVTDSVQMIRDRAKQLIRDRAKQLRDQS